MISDKDDQSISNATGSSNCDDSKPSCSFFVAKIDEENFDNKESGNTLESNSNEQQEDSFQPASAGKKIKKKKSIQAKTKQNLADETPYKVSAVQKRKQNVIKSAVKHTKRPTDLLDISNISDMGTLIAKMVDVMTENCHLPEKQKRSVQKKLLHSAAGVFNTVFNDFGNKVLAEVKEECMKNEKRKSTVDAACQTDDMISIKKT